MNARDWEKYFYHLLNEAECKYGSEMKEWMAKNLYHWKRLNGLYEEKET